MPPTAKGWIGTEEESFLPVPSPTSTSEEDGWGRMGRGNKDNSTTLCSSLSSLASGVMSLASARAITNRIWDYI